MKTVREVSRVTGVSVRALHYYDSVGLLHPAKVTEAGYRLYDGESLRRLQSILLFRELNFPLAEIRKILDMPHFDADAALEQQIELLKLKRERIDRMIAFAAEIKKTGVMDMDFSVFDDKKQKAYEKQAKERWGNTEAYREFESKELSEEEMKDKSVELIGFFRELGRLTDREESDSEVQALVGKLRAFITANFYNCTVEIFSGLGQMYAAGGEMTENIDRAGGPGTASFASRAIAVYCTQA